MRWLIAFALVASPVAAQDVTQSTIGLINIAPTGTPLNLGDDATAQVQLGFSFDYFGQSFTQAWVSSNGFLSFSTSDNLCCNGWPIESAPRNSIFANWSDLISGGNPYVQTLTTDLGTAFVAGWYNTQEFGSWQPNTFEIQLYESGTVNIAYGNLSNIYHTITAGLTGPTSSDNLSIFYGQNVGAISNTSYSYAFAPSPQVVDCNKTPLDPSCPPIVVAYSPVSAVTAQDTTPTAQEEVTASVEQETTAEAAEQIASDVEQAVAVIEQAAVITAEPEVKQEAATTEKVEAKAQSERLSPAQLAALLSNRGPVATALLIPGASSEDEQDSNKQQSDQQSASNKQEAPSQSMADSQRAGQQAFEQIAANADAALAEQQEQASIQAQQQEQEFVFQDNQGEQASPAFVQAFSSMAGEGQTFTNAGLGSLSNQVQLIEILNSASSQERQDATPEKPDKEMQQLAGPVSLAAYAQVRIPDVAFYNEREIYRKNRPVDAYMLMYRLMMTNDRTWSAMVDAQYER